jgi:hypothetical protein
MHLFSSILKFLKLNPPRQGSGTSMDGVCRNMGGARRNDNNSDSDNDEKPCGSFQEVY